MTSTSSPSLLSFLPSHPYSTPTLQCNFFLSCCVRFSLPTSYALSLCGPLNTKAKDKVASICLLLHIPEFFPPAEIFDTKRPQERKRLFFFYFLFFYQKRQTQTKRNTAHTASTLGKTDRRSFLKHIVAYSNSPGSSSSSSFGDRPARSHHRRRSSTSNIAINGPPPSTQLLNVTGLGIHSRHPTLLSPIPGKLSIMTCLFLRRVSLLEVQLARAAFPFVTYCTHPLAHCNALVASYSQYAGSPTEGTCQPQYFLS